MADNTAMSRDTAQALFADIEAAEVEQLLDKQSLLNQRVMMLDMQAMWAQSEAERNNYLTLAAECRGRISQMFAEACLKNLISITRRLYEYVDERISGEEARLPALTAEAVSQIEHLNQACARLLGQGGVYPREERNLAALSAVVDVSRLDEIRERLRPGFDRLELGDRAYLSGLLASMLGYVYQAR